MEKRGKERGRDGEKCFYSSVYIGSEVRGDESQYDYDQNTFQLWQFAAFPQKKQPLDPF